MAIGTYARTTTLTAAVAALLALVTPWSAHAQLTSQELKCKHLLVKKTSLLGFAKVFRARAVCENEKMTGELSATVDCTADPAIAGGAGSGSSRLDRKLERLFIRSNQLALNLENKCATAPAVLPSTLDLDVICAPPSEVWGEIAVCGYDLMKARAERLLDLAYRDGAALAEFDERECRSAIATRVRRAFLSRMRSRSDCLRAVDKGTGGLDCRATVAWPGRVDLTGYRRADRRLSTALQLIDEDTAEFCDIDLTTAGFPNLDLLDLTQGNGFTHGDLFNDLADAVLGEEQLFLSTFFSGTAADAFCGNAVLDPATGEQCDDGNRVSCDGCDRDCTFTPSCGNGSACGDNVTTFETCDDGNTAGGDGCSTTCDDEIDNCGNGVVETALGEACDDANAVDCDGCDSDCTLSSLCNNGAVCGAEECDLGLGSCVGGGDELAPCINATDCRGACATGFNIGSPCTTNTDCDLSGAAECVAADGCGGVCASGTENASPCMSDADCPGVCTASNFGTPCTVDSDCGLAGLCSLGGTCTVATLGTACLSDLGCGPGGICVLATCVVGNSDVLPDRCRETCTLPICGDAVTDPGFGEGCDDANAVDGDGCDSNCTPSGCNNGIVTTGEQCDEGSGTCVDGPSAGEPCLADSECLGICAAGPNIAQPCTAATAALDCVGFACAPSTGCTGGNVDSATCRTDCTSIVCGDGIVDPGEECDDGTGTCAGGFDDGASCTVGGDCRGECITGPLAGNPCFVDAECTGGVCDAPIVCVGGNGNTGTCTVSCTIPVVTTTTTTTTLLPPGP